jgi:oxygen-independent coproporphyrinogen-3 oxidase
MQDHCKALLAQAGFQQYEISAYSQPERQCRHNVNYWQFGDYLGIGAGAHSKLSYHDRITREVRHKHPNRYLEKAGNAQDVSSYGETNLFIDREWTIAQEELGFEFMMNALRLIDGFEVKLFQQRTGLDLSRLNIALQLAQDRGLLQEDPVFIKPTLLGQRFLNELLQIFL